MKHLKYALIATVAFSSMTALAQEDQKPESSRNVHIAKLAGYSVATVAHVCTTIFLGYIIGSDFINGKKDSGTLFGMYGLGSLAWLAKYHGCNAIEEYKKAFPTPNIKKEEDSHETS